MTYIEVRDKEFDKYVLFFNVSGILYSVDEDTLNNCTFYIDEDLEPILVREGKNLFLTEKGSIYIRKQYFSA